MDLTPLPLAPALPSQDELPCVHCGYLLRGLDPAGNCPECGTPIRHSAENYALIGVTAAWFTAVRIGLALQFAIVAILVVYFVIYIFAFAARGTLQLWAYSVISRGVLRLFLYATVLLKWWSAQLIASRRTRISGVALDAPRERMARLAAHAMLVLALVEALPLPSFLLSSSAYIYWNIVAEGASIWAVWTLLNVFAAIASDLAQRKLARHAIIVRWLFVIFFGIEIALLLLHLALLGLGTSERIIPPIIYYIIQIIPELIVIVAALWFVVLAIRLYRQLGKIRPSAPIDPSARNPWIPDALRHLRRLLQKARALAAYNGNRGL